MSRIAATYSGSRTVAFREVFDLPAKVLDVRKLPVNRRKAYVSDLIDGLEMVQHRLADGRRRHLGCAKRQKIGLDPLQEHVDLPLADGTLGESHTQLLPELGGVEFLAAAVFLDDGQGSQLDSLIGREPAATHDAFPPAANRFATLDLAAIGHA